MKTLDLLVLVCALSFPVRGQEQFDRQPGDTGSVRGIILLDPWISLGKPMLLLPPSLQGDAVIPPFLIGGERPGVPPPFLGGAMELKADLISPLRLQMESEARLRTMQTVLGTMVVGGAVYAAYYHIKKYGLK